MSSQFDEFIIGESADLHGSIQIALANIPVSELDIEASYLGRPRLTRERFRLLSLLLNDISRYRSERGAKVDLVVLPEVSIPGAWQPMLAHWSRSHGIGIVCGLEHRVDHKMRAHNEVLTILPYRNATGYWSCVPIRRLKRFYSPGEEFVLLNEGRRLPRTMNARHHLYRWRGASFAVYNCFELASIEDRAIFKGHVDFLVATEFNRDVGYFSNIIESAARDLHCYVVQVNASGFGDSRVVVPAGRDSMNPLRIKGGDNLTFLTMRLDLDSLRVHQRKGYGLQKDSRLFKPTPPDFPQPALQARQRLQG
jgi:predicted amidohydrolase